MIAHVCRLSLIAVLVSAAVGSAAPIRVAQESAAGAGDFDSNVLGYINPFVTAGTLQNYYAYSTSNNVSFGFNAPNNNANSGLTTNRSHLFLVQGSNGLGVFVVHDRPGVANGGGSANTAYTVFGSGVGLTVGDDPNGDTYASSVVLNGPQSVTANHNWVSPNTDGLALGSLGGNWQVLMNFYSPGQAAAFTGLDSWAVYSPTGTPISLVLATGRRVQLLPTQVPEPASLLVVGLLTAGGVGYRSLRRRPV